MASTKHINEFCYGSSEQLRCFERMHIRTMEELWSCIASTMPPVPESLPAHIVAYKKHVIGFMKHRCQGIFFDFDKLYRERGTTIGGKYPNQWIALHRDAVTIERPDPPVTWIDDEEAIAEAIRQSLQLVKPPTPDTLHWRPEETLKEAPDSLCCPITLEIFKDPVQTIHGQTYERQAIEDWFASHSTDPMTGCHIRIKVLFADDVMKKQL